VSLSRETVVTVSHRGDFSRIAGPFFSTAKEDLSVYRSTEPPVLMICPASLKLNWGREIHKVAPADAVEVISVRDKAIDVPRWVVINYDQLARHGGRLAGIAWAGVIVDEAHFIKNASQRTSQVLKIIGAPNARTESETGLAQVYLLTGTPMPNRHRDLFNLLRAVGPPRQPPVCVELCKIGGAVRDPADEDCGECRHMRDIRKTAQVDASTSRGAHLT
jgi:SNF2 family DNA or RNA helicase